MALAGNKYRTIFGDPDSYDFQVGTGVTLYQGALVCANATGYAVPGALTASYKFLGLAHDPDGQIANAGADGAVRCQVEFEAFAWLTNSSLNPVVIGDVGGRCYIEDDEKVRTFVGGGVNVVVGCVLDVDATKGVLVYLAQPMLLDGTISGNLSVAGSSSLVGIATFTARDVHSAGLQIAAGQGIDFAGAADITLAAGAFDLTITMGDAAGAQKVSFLDSALVEVARIDSDGNVQCDGTLDVTGIATFTAMDTHLAGLSVAAGQGVDFLGAADITVAAGAFDLTIQMGDNAGAQKVSFADSDAAEVAKIDSNGNLTAVAGTFTGLATLSGGAKVPYLAFASGGVPTQAEMVTAFGAGSDGQIGVYADSTPGVAYVCAFSTALGGWWHLAMTAVGA